MSICSERTGPDSNLPTFTILVRGATPETVKKAFEILLADTKVKSIFINIFGGVLIPQLELLSAMLIIWQGSCAAITSQKELSKLRKNWRLVFLW